MSTSTHTRTYIRTYIHTETHTHTHTQEQMEKVHGSEEGGQMAPAINYYHCVVVLTSVLICSSCISAFMDCIVPEDIAYCQNGGTCRINLLTESLSCVCTSAYVGDACEQGTLGTADHQSFSLSGSCFIFEDVMCRRIYNRHVRCLFTLQMWMNV